ncbi:MAG: hypothetical protein ACTSVI_04365 [Promethearchaeota archaeon]
MTPAKSPAEYPHFSQQYITIFLLLIMNTRVLIIYLRFFGHFLPSPLSPFLRDILDIRWIIAQTGLVFIISGMLLFNDSFSLACFAYYFIFIFIFIFILFGNFFFMHHVYRIANILT